MSDDLELAEVLDGLLPVRLLPDGPLEDPLRLDAVLGCPFSKIPTRRGGSSFFFKLPICRSFFSFRLLQDMAARTGPSVAHKFGCSFFGLALVVFSESPSFKKTAEEDIKSTPLPSGLKPQLCCHLQLLLEALAVVLRGFELGLEARSSALLFHEETWEPKLRFSKRSANLPNVGKFVSIKCLQIANYKFFGQSVLQKQSKVQIIFHKTAKVLSFKT